MGELRKVGEIIGRVGETFANAGELAGEEKPKPWARYLKDTPPGTSYRAPVADEFKCNYCRDVGYFRRDVVFGHPDFGRLIPCRCRVEEMSRKAQENRFKLSGLEKLRGEPTFENFNTRVKNGDRVLKAVRAYVESGYNGWLFMQGGYGCGKTHLAAAIVRHAIEHEVDAHFINAPELLLQLRSAYAPDSTVDFSERFAYYCSVAVLVLDDLGAEQGTEWAAEKFYMILNARSGARLATILTTNLEKKDFPGRLKSRMGDTSLVENVSFEEMYDFREKGAPGPSGKLKAVR